MIALTLATLMMLPDSTPTPSPVPFTATRTASPTRTPTQTPNMEIWISPEGIEIRADSCSIHWLYVNNGLKEPGKLGAVFAEGTITTPRLPGESDSTLLARSKAAVKVHVFANKVGWDEPIISGGGTIK